MKTHVVDYGRGNIASVCRGVEQSGGEVVLTTRASDLAKAERVILPGVGAFGDCMSQLEALGFVDAVKGFAATGRPLFGICVGMQVLHSIGEEFGRHAGIGFIPGTVSAIPKTTADGQPHKTPHIGWTPLEYPAGKGHERWKGTILEDVEAGTSVYFVHSFTAAPETAAHRLADCHYNGRLISAAVQRDNITGVQFHPEKSGAAGLKIIERFLRM
ncbi:MAG TPA: imidazole glycerol phosphate synthase subunit HisH [Hyphomicrobiaceae bacterium]|nr:imidazole glycerol phosphate synthase subunit HisH [Hyphomicrobiaceae bacterium]